MKKTKITQSIRELVPLNSALFGFFFVPLSWALRNKSPGYVLLLSLRIC